jgi:hypothetical protein
MVVLFAIRWDSMGYNRRSVSIRRWGVSGTDGQG